MLVGGGTGGHIFPLVAVAEELKAQGVAFVFVGSSHSREEKVVADLGWPFLPISAGKWRRYTTVLSVFENIIDVGRVFVGVFQAIGIIRKTKARLVFSKGSFVALPVVLAAKLTGTPVVIHESDAVMGTANKISARFARKILTNFSPSVFSFADRRFIQVGMPIRRALRQAAALKAPQKSRPVLLILPGSQGATAINNYLKKTLGRLLAIGDVIHLTGEKEYAEFMALKKQLAAPDQSRYKPYSFIDRELPLYFQMADLMVARSSATIVAEAALFKKAAFLIPLPTAAGNHQVVNAKILEKSGAAVVREQHQLTPEIFARDVEDLLQSPERLKTLGQTLHDYFDETGTITKIIKELTDGD